MNKLQKNSGIALISLVVSILIIFMLTGIVTYTGRDILVNSKETAFAKDIEAIYDAAQEYYMVNGSIPSKEEGMSFDMDTYISSISELEDENVANALEQELGLNEEQDSVFYEIDISKIGVEETKYGVNKNENDFFVISNTTQKIYYYPGFKINENVYFSNILLMEK